MHISDGVLSAPAMVGGYAVALGIIGATVKKMDIEDMPKIAVITAVFFVSSLIHIPLGPTSVHLILNGLVGVVLGLSSFISIFIGLTLQCLLFQHGGVTSLGWNACMMGIPALCAHFIFSARKSSVSDFLFETKNGKVILNFLVGLVLLFSSVFCIGAVGIVTANKISSPLAVARTLGAEASFRRQMLESGLSNEVINKVLNKGENVLSEAFEIQIVRDTARNASFYRILSLGAVCGLVGGIILSIIGFWGGSGKSGNPILNFAYKTSNLSREYVFGFISGGFAVFGSGCLLALGLAISGEEFIAVAKLALLAHVFIMVIEGIVVGFTAAFIAKIKPEIIETKKI